MMSEALLLLNESGERLAAWHAADGTFEPAPRAIHNDGVLITSEQARVEFAVEGARPGYEYRVWVGKSARPKLEPDAVSKQSRGTIWWYCDCHFDSANGTTPVTLQSRPEDGSNCWTTVIEAELFVNPTKAGSESIKQMTEDVGRLSRGLLQDIYGKSERLRDIQAMRTLRKQLRHPEDEVLGLESAVMQAAQILDRIAEHPASRIVRTWRARKLRGDERISPRTMRRIMARGHDVRQDTAGATVLMDVKTETFDIPEHRIIAGLLEEISDRARRCARFMSLAIKEIESYRRFRDFTISSNEHSLFEAEDVPKIEYLREGVRRAQQISRAAMRLRNNALIASVPAEALPVGAQLFGQSPEYRAALGLVRAVRNTALAQVEGSSFIATGKDTGRLFEQWSFLHLIEAFRRAGLELGDWDHGLRLHVKSRFVIDFRRGLTFEGRLSHNTRVRFRYEPFVMGLRDAMDAGETLFRSDSAIACTPDITIELQERLNDRWVTQFAMVIDVKYTRNLKPPQWTQVGKYAKIRTVGGNRQVKHLGIVYLQDPERLDVWDDTSVTFTPDGLDCDPSDRVDFIIGVLPAAVKADGPSAFDRFAAGSLRYLRRHFVGG